MNLYVHTPFCQSKCAYCALRSFAVAPRDIPPDFPSLAAREFSLRAAPASFDTLYFGGGTPATLGLDGIITLVNALRAAGATPAGNCEWSVELNPTPALLDATPPEALPPLGFNRVSIGVQSLNDAVLARAGRTHSAADVRAAVARVRSAGFTNIGIDLIAGLPGDSPASWRATLDAAIDLGVAHISLYALTLEDGTPLARSAAAGEWRPCPDDDMLALLASAEERLTSAGFRRYEISNYARPGCECRHNLACWRGEDYLGIGPGASSRTALTRRTNSTVWRAWRSALLNGELPPAAELESITPAEDAEERFLYGLRLSEGVAPDDFAARHPAALPLADFWKSRLAGLASVGIATEIAPGRWALTSRGREVADSAIESLLTPLNH